MSRVELILGGPGCGKTTRLLEIVETALATGTPPDRIAYLAFTRKAAKEAAARAMERFKLDRDSLPYFRTLHSLAFEMLGLTPSDVMQTQHYNSLASILGLEFSEMRDTVPDWMPMGHKRGDQVRAIEMLARVRTIPIERAWREANFRDIPLNEVEQYAKTLQAYKTDAGVLDYIDMVDSVHDSLPVDIVIIDEAQDLSAQQWRMAVTIARKAQKVFIGGDDDQAIFQWAGADVSYFLNLEGGREVLPLSHRLPRNIFNLANTLSGRIGRRYAKDWRPRDADGAVHRIADVTEAPFREGTWMVLARQRFGLLRYAGLLRQLGYPYTMNGRSSTNTGEVKALLAWERLRKGEALKAQDVRHMLRYITGSKPPREDKPYTFADFTYPDAPWFEVLNNMALETQEYLRACLRNKEKLDTEPRIQLSTIHGVKGGEAENVLLSPSVKGEAYENRATDAEHRVFYVGATRAINALWIPTPHTSTFYDI